MKFAFLAMAAYAAISPFAAAQQFDHLITSPFVQRPTSLILDVFDVDSDGLVDVLATGPEFHRNVGHARFEFAGLAGTVGTTTPAAGSNGGDIGDVDGDGDLDMVAGDHLYENLGNGTFAQAPPFLPSSLLGGDPNFLDYDGDGDLDILHDTWGASLWQNDGAGNFTDVSAVLAGLQPDIDHVVVFDADGDGDQDVVLTNGPGSPLNLRLWRNDNGTGFDEEILPVAGFNFGSAVHVADLDGSGTPDVLVHQLLPMGTTILRNDGSGSFTATQPGTGFPTTLELGGAQLGDWTQDGLVDIVTAFGIHENLGGLQFGFIEFPHVDSVALPFRLRDLDGDLDLDLISSGVRQTVILNTFEGPRHATRNQTVSQLALAGAARLPADYAREALLRSGGDLFHVSNLTMAPADPIYQPWRHRLVPSASDVVDATIVDSVNGFLGRDIVTCTTQGAVAYTFLGDWIEQNNGLPALPSVRHVASIDADGQFPTDLVFGDPTIDGPRIFAGGFFAPYVEQPHNLPVAAPSPAPAFETVVVADIDGDGDDDIVHELRLVTNDGNGAYSAGPSFAASVSPNSETLLAFDYDGDGDLDLLVHGENAPTLLLQNDGGTFTDASFGHLPTAEFAPTDLCSAGDVDGDGDTDLLTNRNGSCNLLRNDGGVFTRTANVGPRATWMDANEDGLPDLYTGLEVRLNRHALLHEAHVAIAGIDWQLQVHASRPGVPPTFAWIAISTAADFAQIPNIGTLRIDLGQATLIGVPLSGGYGDATWTIPLTPLVLGVELFAQALLLEPNGLSLTNSVFDRVR